MGEPLSATQIQDYKRNGYLLVENALDPTQLSALKSDLDRWVQESRNHTKPYGITFDNRPRFDIEPGHSETSPALRRIASPVEISDAYLGAMRHSKALDAVTQLIGPNVEFNNAKINSKQPGAATAVKYHQDFLFQPHSNEDLVAVLFFLDDVEAENGPLTVVPGSHNGPMYEHWHGGTFTGAVSDEIAADAKQLGVMCTGPAGSACLMHTRLLHGSEPNLSDSPRTLFIVEYSSEDSVPLDVNHIPSIYEGELVRGERTGRIRTTSFEMAKPELPTTASFFDQQAKAQ